jgi:hypothetical protein
VGEAVGFLNGFGAAVVAVLVGVGWLVFFAAFV